MQLNRKFITGGAAVVLALGLVTVLGAGAATAKGKPSPSPASGTVTCTKVNAVLTFTPPLAATANANASSEVSLNAQLTKCSGGSSKHSKTTGHLSVSAGTVPSNSCPPTTAPAITGANVKWTPPSKVAGSIVTLPAGTVSTVGGNLQFAYTGGTVTGSYPSTSATATVTTTDAASDLAASCSGAGLGAINLKGTATV